MATYLTDDALCLRVFDFSETSQVVTLFSRHHGLLPLLAKGSKRTSKKNTMSGPLDLLTSGQVVFIPARENAIASAPASHSAQLGTLAAWELSDHRQTLRSNLPALNAAMLCAEITTHLVHPHDPHDDLFEELLAALDILPTQRHRTTVAYAKAALTAAGYWPNFATCLACGRSPSSPDAALRFSPQAGGILCTPPAACRIDNSGTTIAIPARIAIALDRLSMPTALRASPPQRPADESALATALQLLLTHIEALTDKPLRTRYLLRTIFLLHPA